MCAPCVWVEGGGASVTSRMDMGLLLWRVLCLVACVRMHTRVRWRAQVSACVRESERRASELCRPSEIEGRQWTCTRTHFIDTAHSSTHSPTNSHARMRVQRITTQWVCEMRPQPLPQLAGSLVGYSRTLSSLGTCMHCAIHTASHIPVRSIAPTSTARNTGRECRLAQQHNRTGC